MSHITPPAVMSSTTSPVAVNPQPSEPSDLNIFTHDESTNKDATIQSEGKQELSSPEGAKCTRAQCESSSSSDDLDRLVIDENVAFSEVVLAVATGTPEVASRPSSDVSTKCSSEVSSPASVTSLEDPSPRKSSQRKRKSEGNQSANKRQRKEGQPEFPCPSCEKSYARRDTLHSHLEKIHKMSAEEIKRHKERQRRMNHVIKMKERGTPYTPEYTLWYLDQTN